MKPTDPASVNRATYDQIAAHFAELHAAMPPSLIKAGERFINLMPAEKNYLDLGCGTGRDLAYLSGFGGHGVGADLSYGMLEQARKTCSAPLAEMDMTSLGFVEASFNGVWCVAALLHLPKAQLLGALREIRRVLVPSGYLYISIQEGEGEGFELADQLDYDRERFFARYSLEELLDRLQKAGFRIIDSGANPAPGIRWIWAFSQKGNKE